ncbi:hypothetical protein [Mucilaginibacter corticis]|nr:hypothetical protein [Mucilaginibacter corticis]
MSKDKGSKNVKKAPDTTGKKSTSDYQAGKKSISREDLNVKKK